VVLPSREIIRITSWARTAPVWMEAVIRRMSNPVPANPPEVEASPSSMVERPVIGARVAPPQLLIGQIGELGGVLPPGQGEQPEDNVRYAPVSVMITCGRLPPSRS